MSRPGLALDDQRCRRGRKQHRKLRGDPLGQRVERALPEDQQNRVLGPCGRPRAVLGGEQYLAFAHLLAFEAAPQTLENTVAQIDHARDGFRVAGVPRDQQVDVPV